MTTSLYDVIVIGAGANGLVAAATLGKAGKRVLLIDRAEMLGGQSRPAEFAPGFRAPVLGLDGGWLPPIIAKELGLRVVPMTAPVDAVSVATGDGDWLALPCDRVRAADAIRKHSARDAARWSGFIDRIESLTRFMEALYVGPAPDVDTTSFTDLTRLFGLGRRFRALGRERMTELLRVLPMSVEDFLDDEFESALVKAAVGAGGVRDVRQGPRSQGTTFNLLHYLAGAPFGSVRTRSWWRDGPEQFNVAVENIARMHGVTIRANARVARILVRDDAVAGVLLDDAEEIFSSIVISTADPARTLLGMIDPVWLDPEFIHAVRNIRFHGATAFVQYAVDRLPDIPALNAVASLSPSLEGIERAADAAKYGMIAERPHVELTAPTLRWPQLAPQGKHVIVARVQYAPYALRDHAPWDAARADVIANAVTARIAECVPGFANTVLHRAVLTPADLESQYGLTEGAASHGEMMLDQVLFMRPVAGWSRYAMPIAGLYLGGSGAHPGPGVLGAAGWMAAKAALKK